MLATIPVGQAITFSYFISEMWLVAGTAARGCARSQASAPWMGWAAWQLLKTRRSLFFLS